MKKRSVLSLLLALSILLSLALPAATTAYAEGEADQKKGMETSKSIAYDEKTGEYTITLEAYATGEKVISQITQDVPADIILVLDQSGSMEKDIGTVSYSQYTGYNTRNSSNYDNRHNGGNANLWYMLDDGSYVSVSVTRQEAISYTLITNGRNNSTNSGATNYWNNRNNLYARVDGQYQKVTVSRTGGNGTYTYSLPNNTQIASSNGRTSTPSFTGIDGNGLYIASIDDTQTVYTYTYTDSKGTVQTIGTSTGANTNYTPAFYQRTVSTSGGGSRLDALKTAVTSFANAVAEKAKGKDSQLGTPDDINHRIAVVGFASKSGYGDNTELLSIAGQNSGSVGVAYNDITDQNLKDVMQNMNEAAGQAMITNAIDALAANGATQTDLGMDMAKRILDANPVQSTEKRNRVVIVFTDGSPTSFSGFETGVANTAINTATTIKNGGTTVYTIGVFSGADATSAGTKPNGDLGQNDSSLPAASNWFMQQVSSNNGTPQTPSYYLSAGDSTSLSNIFQQISDNIETGGSSVELDDKTVIKDIITPQFTLPEGATVNDITLETWKCTGKDGDAYTWEKNADAMGAKATITSTDDSHATTTKNQVNVTGFDFKENYVGTVTENGTTTYRGNKLVIKFNVTPRAGFLGGNGVITNGAESGVYKDNTTENPEFTFVQPDVDVTIKEPTVTVPDANVYLGAYFKDTVSADQLKEGTTVSFDDGKITLDLTKGNDKDKPWGLEPWQTKYVDITVTVTDKDGNVVTDFENITEDTDYTVSVSIQPKTDGTSSGTNEKGEGIIHVFTPELTYKDSTAYYGESVPTNNDYSANLTTTNWKHVDGTDVKYSTDVGVTMLGSQTPPTLNITYTPDASKLDGTKYGKQDVPVTAKVSILGVDVTKYTTFLHQKCAGETWTATGGEPAFQVHIKTCQLTITKTGGNENEPYVFDVYKDGEKYTQVTVVGNNSKTIYELPVGTYTIEEDTGWSWRFTADNGTSAVLDSTVPTGEITCTNTLQTNQWLNGFSQVIRNIFGAAKH